MRRRRTSLAVPALCVLFSLLVHGLGLAGLARWWKPRPVTPPERITYLELQPEAPEAKEPEPPEVEPPQPPKREKKREARKPEIELDELPEPEEEQEEPEEEEEKPPEEEPTPPVDFVLEQLKMVEQPDELDEDDAPEDANYLSNVNRDVDEETRAKVTNLEQDALQQQAKQLEASDAPEQGTASETVVAQDQEERSQVNREAPKTTPHKVEERPEQNDPKPKSLLAMRELEQRDHRMAQDVHEALAAESEDGSMQPDREQQSSIEPREQQARIDKHDKAYKFKLSQNDLQALFGKDDDPRKAFQSKQQSKQKGVWEDQRAHWQSPLENMVPEVQVGNQTALRSRKHPFARYIAQMHRKIHEAWAWGFLEQLDTRGRTHPLNDYGLWSRLEIVLNGDGTIDKVMTVHHSGKLAFDAAAREIIYSSGPFPDPPREILSPNGKIYIHWAFHRDERACGTFGAQPFILDGAGGDRPDPDVRVRARRGGEQMPRRLKRGKGSVPAPHVAEGPAPPPGGGGHEGHSHAEGSKHRSEGGAMPSPGTTPSADDLASDPDAGKVANAWLHYFSKGQIDKTMSRSSLPFHAGDSPIARTREELRDVLRTMSEESKAAGRPKAAKVLTAAGMRKVYGSVPAGVQEGGGRVYGLTRIGSEYVVLMLEKRFGSWRVVGITR